VFFPDNAPFERRSRRPPHNAPNAILSYAYTLLSAEAEACLYAIGLDPALGFYHEPATGRPSLALDIIEPFRAPLADAMALDLLTHGILNPKAHFENRDVGVYLNVEGRKRFFVAYERRMEREFTSEQHGSRTVLRRELHNQCRAVKKAISQGEPFEPFLMN
jgi:CRISPR-associated protein Cas1